MSECAANRKVKHGLARLVAGFDTDLFDNGVSPPWKDIGQLLRKTPIESRMRVLEVEVRRVDETVWGQLVADLSELDATREYETENEHTVSSLQHAVQFPIEALPDVIARFVREGARSLHCPTDYIGPPLLGFLGGAIGGTRRIEIKRGWTEQPLLYVLVIGGSGTKKSPAAKLVSQFADSRAREYATEFGALMEEYAVRTETFDDDLSDYKAHRRRHHGSPSCGQRPDAPDKPILKRTVVDDATVEALVRVLAENPRGVILHKEELAGLLRGLNQYKGGHGSDDSFFQSAWDGKSIIVDRKSLTRPYLIARPFLGIIGGIQPDVISSVLGGMRLVDGMAARFLVAYPKLMEQQLSDEVVSEECLQPMCDLFQRLYELSPLEAKDDGYEPMIVPLSREAYVEFNHWQSFNNARINACSEFDPRRAPIAKMPSQLGRMSLIIHQVRVCSGEAVDPYSVDAESVARAAMIADYFLAHVDRVWQILSESRPDRQSRQLYAWMSKQEGRVTKRDIVRYGVAGIRSTDEAEVTLCNLEQAELVKRQKTSHTELFAVIVPGRSGD